MSKLTARDEWVLIVATHDKTQKSYLSINYSYNNYNNPINCKLSIFIAAVIHLLKNRILLFHIRYINLFLFCFIPCLHQETSRSR